MKKRLLLILNLSTAALLVLSFAVGGVAFAVPTQSGTPEPGLTETRTPDLASPQDGTEPVDESSDPTPTDVLEGVILTRTPMPTATPGVVEQEVERLTESVGLGQASFLGLEASDWINLVVSLLAVITGYLIGTALIRYVLPRIVRRTSTEFDDRLLAVIGSDVRWLVVIWVLRRATTRLTFVGAGPKTFLLDVYFIVSLVLIVVITFRLIGLADDVAHRYLRETDREVELEGVTVMLTRVARVTTAAVGLIILLTHFGVNVTALTAALGLGGLAITLAAQDTISDMIAGVIILFDRPFRVGDRIEIQAADTWGDVLDIGLRTTRIRTRDNRVVIVPNSTISSNRVMNYSYPDPSYRSEIQLSVGYDTDLEVARNLIVDTIRGVDGVLASKPIDALYIEMGDSGIIFRVRWWIGTYEVFRTNSDQVHTALQAAFDQAGIAFAPKTQSVNLQVDPETVRRVSSTFQGRGDASVGEKTDA
jgi:MscS family membrane protein